MLNLSAPRVPAFLVFLALIGLAVASLNTRIPTVGPSVVRFGTWLLIRTYVVLFKGP